MNVRQLSVFIDSASGNVSSVTEALGAARVNIRGFSVSDNADYGVVRLIVDDPERGWKALADAGFAVKEHDVVCLDLPDYPGGLAGVLKAVADCGVVIEYVYSLISTHVVVNVADADRAVAMLRGSDLRVASQEEIASP